jgi:hypothetical protein
VAGCATDTDDPLPIDDVCAAQTMFAAGTSEMGLGASFSPIVDGQEATVTPGASHLWTFTVNTRVSGMDIGSGPEHAAAVFFTARDQAGEIISLDVGCRAREFVTAGDNRWQLAESYQLALWPQFTPVLDGSMVTLQVEVLDRSGRRAGGEHRVVARLPR